MKIEQEREPELEELSDAQQKRLDAASQFKELVDQGKIPLGSQEPAAVEMHFPGTEGLKDTDSLGMPSSPLSLDNF